MDESLSCTGTRWRREISLREPEPQRESSLCGGRPRDTQGEAWLRSGAAWRPPNGRGFESKPRSSLAPRPGQGSQLLFASISLSVKWGLTGSRWVKLLEGAWHAGGLGQAAMNLLCILSFRHHKLLRKGLLVPFHRRVTEAWGMAQLSHVPGQHRLPSPAAFWRPDLGI